MMKQCGEQYSCTRQFSWRKLSTIITLISLASLFLLRFEQTDNPLLSYKIKNTSNIVLVILTEWEQMNTRVRASQDTWIKQMSYDVLYFVGRYDAVTTTLPKAPNIIDLPCRDDEYPPVNKTYAMWHHLYMNYVMDYQFFVAVDSDTYVNVKHLETLIKNLTCSDCYVGFSMGDTNPKWRNLTGLQVPFCQGMGYIISRSTLLQFGPYLHSCRTSFFGRHSDTEIGRCIYKHVHNLSCSNGKIPFKMVSYTTNEKNEKVGLRFNAREQMHIEFPLAPPTEFFQAVMVHPLSSRNIFISFINKWFITYGLFCHRYLHDKAVLPIQFFNKKPILTVHTYLNVLR